VLASEGERLPALSGGNGFVTMSLEDIPQELHIERVVLDDQDPFRRRFLGRNTLHWLNILADRNRRNGL
jgi:hypothetical protein